MGAVVAAINSVIKTQSMDELEKKRSIFNAVRTVEDGIECDLERDFLEE
jgi:hypothetical protein